MSEPTPRGYIQPLAVRQRIERLQPAGLPIINLSFNELPYPPTKSVLAAIQTATAHANNYGDPTCKKLAMAIGDTHELDPNRIVCGNGSEELLDIIGRCFAGSGDEIVISEYGYILFSIISARVGAELVKAKEDNFTTQIDNILAVVTDTTRIVFIANPNNPTGTMVSASELRRLAHALSPQTILVLDLAYSEFGNDNYINAVYSIASDYNNVVITRTFSKAFGLAGLRAGWCYAPEWMVPVLYAARGMGTVNAAAQAGAIAALDDQKTMLHRVSNIQTEKNRVAASLSAVGFDVVPGEANFLMAAPPGGSSADADKLTTHLFDDAGIIINQTREAGLERFIRFSISLPEHNTRLISSVKSYMDQPLEL